MEETTKQILIDPEPEQALDKGADPLAESGFEEEQPETGFDERI